MRAALPLLGLLVLAACGGDSNGPTQNGVEGVWEISVPSLSVGSGSCSMSGVTMTISMSSKTAFSGTHTVGTINCGTAGASTFAAGEIQAGSLNGDDLSFNFDDSNFRFTGKVTASGQTMSGTASLYIDAADTATGAWSADRLAESAAIAAQPAVGARLSDVLPELLH